MAIDRSARRRFLPRVIGAWLFWFVLLPVAAVGLVAARDGELIASFWFWLTMMALPVWSMRGLFILRRGVRTWRSGIAGLRIGCHVLFLRPFTLDQNQADSMWLENTYVLPGTIGMMYRIMFPPRSLKRELARTVHGRVGDLATIGSNKSFLPELGVRHIYASNAEWQGVVKCLSSSAVCVILQLGDMISGKGGNQGFAWELEHVRNSCNPCTLFMIIGRSPEEEGHWEEIHERLATAGFHVPNAFPGGGSVVGFNGDWSPHLLVLGAEHPREYAEAIAEACRAHYSKGD